jgi:hypothetical protein
VADITPDIDEMPDIALPADKMTAIICAALMFFAAA